MSARWTAEWTAQWTAELHSALLLWLFRQAERIPEIRTRCAVGLSLLLALAMEAVAQAPPTAHGATTPDQTIQALPYFETIGNPDTIPQNVVTALAEDQLGQIWIGSQIGLLRFDGYRFVTHLHDPRDERSLSGNYVYSLMVASDGRVWVGTRGDGVVVYEHACECFHQRYRHDPLDSGTLSDGSVPAMVEDTAGTIWIATDGGLSQLTRGSRAFVRHVADGRPGALIDSKITSLKIGHDGTLWVGTFSGLMRWRAAENAFEAVASDPGSADSLAGQEITALFEAADGKLWIGTRTSGAAWLDPADPRLRRVASTGARVALHPFVFAIGQPHPDEIWLGSYGGGITRLAANDGRILQTLRHEASVVGTLAHDQVSALHRDRSGLFWIGIWGGGLQRYHSNQAIRVLRHRPGDPASLSQPDVHAVLERSDGNLLVGLQSNGIDILDRDGRLIGGYRPRVDAVGELADGSINALLEAGDGTLWVAVQQAGVLRLERGAERWEQFGVNDGLPTVRVFRLAFVGATLWAGTDAGLARWLPEQRRFEPVATIDGSIPTVAMRGLAAAPDGRLWVGSSSAGLFVVEPGTTRLRSIRHDVARPDSLISDTLNGLLVDRRGRLWVDTGQGLDRLRDWDGERASFEHISDLAGHPGRYFGGNLLEDAQGRLWTQWNVLNPETLEVTDLGRVDGMEIGTAWVGSYAKMRDGRLLYGGTQGLAIVDPERFAAWTYAPPVIATEVKVDGRTRPLGVLSPRLELLPEQRNFSIGFAALDYSAPARNRYAYRLTGFDRDWIETDSEHRNASYGGLWPGDYTLEVRGSGRNGQWSPQQLRVPITVLPAFWQTGWFLALSVLGIGALAWGGVRWRTARLGAEARALQALVDTRTAELSEQKEGIEQQRASLEQAHTTLAGLGEIGREITATLDESAVCATLYQHASELLDAATFSIYLLDPERAELRSIMLIENGIALPADRIDLESTRPAARCARERAELLLDWAPDANDPAQVPGTLDSLSALFVPMTIGPRLLGVLTVQSPRRHVYGDSEQLITRTLGAYAAIALDNAAVYRKLQQTDAMLKRSLLEQELIFDSVAAAIYFVKDRVIRRCNRGMEEMLGYAPGELIGRSTTVLYSSLEDWKTHGEKVYGLIVAGRVAEGEREVVRKDGGTVWVSYFGRSIDLTDPEQGTVWVSYDISERKRSEAALERALREQEILFDNDLVGVMFTKDRSVVRCNRGLEQILGYGPGEITGHSTRIFFADDAAWERFGRTNFGALAGGGIAHGDVEYVRKDGQTIWAAFYGKAIDPDDLSQGVIWAGTDITERKRNEEALIGANRDLQLARDHLLETQQQLVQQEKMAALGTLTAGVAHEINNPTNFADGAVQHLQAAHQQLHDFLRHLAGEEAPAEILQAIAERFVHLDEMTATAREGHERIKRIVRDLRQFTRLDEAERKSVPIAEPIQSTVNLVRTRFDRIRFDLDLASNPNIDCQPAKLGQVFLNLIINACEALSECTDGRVGVIAIRTVLDWPTLQIDISDNGPGMDETTRQRVFEPFFTTKAVGAGTGLGLAIVFGIVRDHNGSIEVESTPGQGTRFRIRLPVRARTA